MSRTQSVSFNFLPSITASTIPNALEGVAKTHVVGRGYAFTVKAGSHIRIINLHGEQVVDMTTWRAPYSSDTTCNFAEAMTTYLKENVDPDAKFEWFQVHNPFNTFQNTQYYTMKSWIDSSKPGDFIEFEVLMDTVVAVSCCPYEEGGFKGGKSTEIAVSWQTAG
ncbi:hypothetical protein CC77DRAFT_1004697 [Alternaria alternata]|uniref:DUF1989 domain-containing protein n=1 Tax=Alternaria alternata TaxID=5599 RepID=A0A177DZ71_ALTAL|nr:hypothetical protein CC77DRAFT_1004697 [Alternaria alternata]OAG25024.1 hypothetical protein CC77DRAFT_1004697 [Alternaria alternata]